MATPEVPIARGCQQAILIGDQCQLPPTATSAWFRSIMSASSAVEEQILTTSQVLSDVAETENLGESLFTRLVTQGVRPGPLAGGIIGWW